MQNEDDPQTPSASTDGVPGDPSRRRFLIGSGAAVLLAGGIGTVAAVATEKSSGTATAPNPPADLIAAASAERALIAAVDRAISGRSAPAARLALIRSDHVAHLQALEAAVALVHSSPSPVPTSAGGSPTPISAAQLARLEAGAAKTAAGIAARLTGNDATLLASIAACEACHVELLR